MRLRKHSQIIFASTCIIHPKYTCAHVRLIGLMRDRGTGATILEVVYGMDVESEEGYSYFKIVEKAVKVASEVGNPGSYLGTSMPI